MTQTRDSSGGRRREVYGNTCMPDCPDRCELAGREPCRGRQVGEAVKPSVAKRYQQMVDAATTRCGEPVVAVLTCQHVGTYGRALEAIGGLASVKRRSAKRAAGGLPDNVLLALTSSSLHAFDFRPTMRGVKLRKQAASWPRPDVRIQTEPRLAVTILWITVSSRQDTIELETPSVMGAQEILDLFLETLDG